MSLEPLVSCVMVTADRPELARRAVHCFATQTYHNCELVIVDDGEADYTSLIRESPVAERIRYHRLSDKGRTLGDLRNLTIELSSGDWIMQWDDDEWYHPMRVSEQLHCAIEHGVGASALRWTLMKVPSDDGSPLIFRSDSGLATPGTILFRKGEYRYPSLRRNEDGVFLRVVRDAVGLTILDRGHSHLFVREFHGSNTWDREHFLRKLRRTPLTWPAYAWARHVRRDVSTMSRFRLTDLERATARAVSDWRPVFVESAR